jgi:catechol 2,3-dioxygenase-like lactoylglutathione lyase family enzyme
VSSRLHHVAIGARDVEALARFYREVFELSEVRRFDYPDGSLRSIWLESGGVLLMIEASAEPTRAAAGALGPFLLAFAVDPERRAHAERALTEAGSAVELRTEFTSYARDPEGNRVAVSHHPG